MKLRSASTELWLLSITHKHITYTHTTKDLSCSLKERHSDLDPIIIFSDVAISILFPFGSVLSPRMQTIAIFPFSYREFMRLQCRWDTSYDSKQSLYDFENLGFGVSVRLPFQSSWRPEPEMGPKWGPRDAGWLTELLRQVRSKTKIALIKYRL